MVHQHPLAYLVGLQGLALLQAWSTEADEPFVRARLDDVRRLLDDDTLRDHPGVEVETAATDAAYRGWATSYDDAGNELLGLDLRFVDEVLDGLPPGDAVDVACGTGRIAGRLAAHGHRVVGVDSSPAMLARARQRTPLARFTTGAMDRLPLADGSADVVTDALAMTHVPDLRRAYAELARVLRPGGTAVVTDVHPDLVLLGSTVKGRTDDGRPLLAATHRHTVADHLAAALAAGLDVIRFEELRVDRSPDSEPAESPDAGPDAPDPVSTWAAWDGWPWTLLDLAPEAAPAVWDVAAVMAWRFERR